MERQRTPKELNDLGDQAFNGQGIERNIELAYTYYKQAADMNNPVGIYNLGKYYYAKANYKQAYQLFRKAADIEYGPSFIKLYKMHLDGAGVRKSKKKAFKYLKQGANTHDSSTYHLLARMYEEGLGTAKNSELAKEYYELSATKNHLEGMYGYGLFLLKQKDKGSEHETAFYWLDKAAHQHYQPAIIYLIELYQKPHPYLKKRSRLYLAEMTFHYQELLAKTNDIKALHLVVKAYEEGRDYLSINYQKVYGYYQKLHELDDVIGYLGMGKCCLYGLGTEKDYEKAIDYLEIASSRNISDAKNLLGDIYRHGYSVATDYQKAKSYYIGAAEEGNELALINLSLLHYRKQIKNASPAQAFTYIQRAAEKNVSNAYFWLGLYYELGVGTEKDLDKSKAAYQKAIDLGNNASRYKLASLIYGQIKKLKLNKRKMDTLYQEVKTLLMQYIEIVEEDNRLKAMYLLGDLYLEPEFKQYSQKISRYYFESAAHLGYTKAMNRMFDIYEHEDVNEAIDWLFKATENPQDGESYYKLSICYEMGLGKLDKDITKAHQYLKKSAEMSYAKALEKITLQGA